MNFDPVEKIAAAILYEGYILYPYRPSAIKNRQRWNFGTLYPRQYAEAQRPQETFGLVAECLVVGDALLDVRIRFLQLVRQKETVALTDPSLAWEEAVERTSEHTELRVIDLLASPLGLQLEVPTADPSAPLRSGRDDKRKSSGDESRQVGPKPPFTVPPLSPLSSQPERTRISDFTESDDRRGCGSPQRETHELDRAPKSPQAIRGSAAEGSAVTLRLQLTIAAERVGEDTCKVRLSVENVTPASAGATREETLPLSFVSAHLLLGVTGGEFVSLLDPDDQYADVAADCTHSGVFPVLVGDEPDRSMMLCSPIILYDYPKIAPQSAGDFFDGTEMDEMLALRVLTLTDAEKQEMRNGDARARRILERTEALTSEAMLETHGVLRVEEWNPFAETKAPPESVRIDGVELRTGDRVRLCPRKKADIFDMALKGKVAVIEAIEQDFEDHVQLAVVLDDDPGREFGMMRQPGHRFFFSPEEVEPA